jgi:hypothetical protein
MKAYFAPKRAYLQNLYAKAWGNKWAGDLLVADPTMVQAPLVLPNATPVAVAPVAAPETVTLVKNPKFIEDETYHGHGNRVFVDASLTLTPEWKPTTSEATPEGMKAYMAPEWAYLQNLVIAPVAPVADVAPALNFFSI